MLSTWFSERFARLEALGAELVGNLHAEDGRIVLSEAARRRMKSTAGRYLAGNDAIDGCGLIFAHTALGTENGHLEWWVREDDTRFARYSFGVVPGGDRYYDYEQHEWFVRAFNEGTPSLVGPYIDYLGVEAYVLTLTVPADLDGRRIGAVGNDIQLEDLESALLPLMLTSAAELAIIGRRGNVLVSNSSRFVTGAYAPDPLDGFSRLRLGPESAGVELLHAVSG